MSEIHAILVELRAIRKLLEERLPPGREFEWAPVTPRPRPPNSATVSAEARVRRLDFARKP